MFSCKIINSRGVFTLEGIAFQIIGLEYDRLSLNKLALSLRIVKLLFETDLNELFREVSALIWKRPLIYWGDMALSYWKHYC